MQYMFLIYRAESVEPTPGSAEFNTLIQEYGKFSQEITEAGVMVSGDPLEKISAATTIKVRNNRTETTDGPFAETNEQLGGYYILDCKDLDEAIVYAAKIPAAKIGSVEVRPIMNMEM